MKVLVVGAGSVGLRLSLMLRDSGDYRVVIGDCVEEALAGAEKLGLEIVYADANRIEELTRTAAGYDVVIAAVPDHVVPKVADAAVAAGVHYFDFSNASVQTSEAAAHAAEGRAFLPGCGVSPGLVDHVVSSLVAAFDRDVDLVVRVGAIPRERTNRLGYGFIWNLKGLFAEYTAPCEAIRNGRLVTLPALSEKEEIVLDGVTYEAFSTAGGLNSLASRFQGKVRNLVFQTIRYPGHLDYMEFLLDDLGLRKRRDLFLTLLQNGMPVIDDDVALISVSARGERDGRKIERSMLYRIDDREPARGPLRGNALALGSAAHVAALLDLLRGGRTFEEGVDTLRYGGHARILDNRFLDRIMRPATVEQD